MQNTCFPGCHNLEVLLFLQRDRGLVYVSVAKKRDFVSTTKIDWWCIFYYDFVVGSLLLEQGGDCKAFRRSGRYDLVPHSRLRRLFTYCKEQGCLAAFT